MKQLAYFSTMIEKSSTHVSADCLRKNWKGKRHPNSEEAQKYAGVSGDFKRVFCTTRSRETRRTNSFVRTYNLTYKEALGSIGEHDQRYLKWFMSERAREPYSFLEIDQDAFSTQTAIYFIQSLHRCLGERKRDGERCYAVFSNVSDPGGSSILVMQSDRLEVLRLMSLPHLDRSRMLPLHPFYLRRFGYSPARIRDQRWVYFHAVKSMIIYICSLIDPKVKDMISGVTPMGHSLFPELYMRIPQIIDLFAETDADVVRLLKESYSNPQSGFLRALKAFLLQDKLHYISKESLRWINLWFSPDNNHKRELRNKFPAQCELLFQLGLTMNTRAHEGHWIPIQKPVVNVKPDGHQVQSRRKLNLKSSTGDIVDEEIPLHTLLYQLVLTDKSGISKEDRKYLFMSIVVDPDVGENYKHSKSPGANLWADMKDQLANYENEWCDSYGEDTGGRVVKSAWELCNMAKFMESLENTSRMSKKTIESSEYLGNLCNFKLKNLLQDDKDLPVFIESAREVVHFGEFFPSIQPHLDLGASYDAVGIQLTREFLEFHYLARVKSYFRDRENWDSSHMDIDDDEVGPSSVEEEEPIEFYTDEMLYNAAKRAKTVRRVKIAQLKETE